MRKLLRFLLAATAVLTLAPTAASALPSPCYAVCDSTSDCSDICYSSGGLSTCGDWGICASAREEPSEETASVTRDEALRYDEAAPVCSEPRQATESLASAES